MYETILVATDGSDRARSAVLEAFDLAASIDAAVHVMSVVDVGATYPAEYAGDPIVDALEREAESVVEELVSIGENRDVTVDGIVGHGTPHQEILEYARENDVDLIVMSTRGRRGLDRVLLGSVTERVVRLSPVPVLTIRASESQPEE